MKRSIDVDTLTKLKIFISKKFGIKIYRLVRKIYNIFYTIYSLIVLIILYPIIFFISLFKEIKIAYIRTERIGHLALNTEIFLRRLQKNIHSNNCIYILIPTTTLVANRFLLNKYKESLFVVENIFLVSLLASFIKYKTKFAFELDCVLDAKQYDLFQETKPTITLTKEEEDRGKKILKKLGIDSWFVCIFARDTGYLKALEYNRDYSYHDYRNFDIDTITKASQYIIKQGGFVVRIGNAANKPFAFKHPKVIDYSFSKYLSDFMDIYLATKMKFIIGSHSGAIEPASVFDTPMLNTNVIPIDEVHITKNSISIPKKLKVDGKYLSLKKYLEIIATSGLDFLKSSDYETLNIEIINNTDDEILEATKEMNERLDGTFIESTEVKKLQERYLKIHSKSKYGGIKTKIGSNFLSKNSWYLS